MFKEERNMKLAIIGSRSLTNIALEQHVRKEVEEIVSGGAIGVDSCAAEYAKKKGLKFTEFLPQYERYGRAAPIARNKEIVDYSDKLIIFWDGKSRGTRFVIEYARKIGKPYEIIRCE